MATININIGNEDVLNINVAGTQHVEHESIKELHDKLKVVLNAYNSKRYKEEHKHWWYEVFIDFSEDFKDFIYPIIKDMDFEEQYTYCLGYMWRRDSYYFSEEHYDFLNKLANEVNK